MGELEPTMTVGRAHHGDLDALIAQSSDTSRPFSVDRASAFELEAKLAKEINAMCPIYKVTIWYSSLCAHASVDSDSHING